MIEIEEENCEGCHICVDVCPQVFSMITLPNGRRKAIVVNPEGCKVCDCKKAVELCPGRAIKLLKENHEIK